MRVSALQEIVLRIDSLPVHSSAKEQFRQLVQVVAREYGVQAVVRFERAQFAASLLRAGIARAAIVERLTARNGISREQAYRDIRKAIELCQRLKPYDTSSRQNDRVTTCSISQHEVMEKDMQKDHMTDKAQSAAQKLASGALLTIEEVAAKLDLSVSTVLRLPLQPIRLGRSVRFDPKDVQRLIEAGREPVAA